MIIKSNKWRNKQKKKNQRKWGKKMRKVTEMRKAIEIGNGSKLLYAMGQDRRSLSQNVHVWYKKGRMESECMTYTRCEALKAGFPKLKRDMVNWGIQEEKCAGIIGKITEYVEACPEEEIIYEGMGDNINTVIADFLAELVYQYEGRKDSANVFLYGEQCLYVQAKYFDKLVKEVGDGEYSTRKIRLELKCRGILRTNKRRCTLQKRVNGEVVRYIAIYWEKLAEKIKEECPGEAQGEDIAESEAPERDFVEEERERAIRQTLEKMCGAQGEAGKKKEAMEGRREAA